MEGHRFQALVFRLEFVILKILQMKIGLIVLEAAIKGQLVEDMVVMLATQAMELQLNVVNIYQLFKSADF